MGQSDFSIHYFAALSKIKQQTLSCWSAWEAGDRWCSGLTSDTVGLHPQGFIIMQLERRVWAMSHFSSQPMCSFLGIKIQQCVHALAVESPWPSLTITTLSGLHEWKSLPGDSSEGLNETVFSSSRKPDKLLKVFHKSILAHADFGRTDQVLFFSFAVGGKERLWLVAVNPRVRDN